MTQMSREMKDGMWVGIGLMILAPLFILLFSVSAVLLEAYVVTKLWNWFVTVPFDTIKMHYGLAVGLTTLTGFMTRQFIPYQPNDTLSKKESQKKLLHSLSFVFIAPLVVLLIGWIASSYV